MASCRNASDMLERFSGFILSCAAQGDALHAGQFQAVGVVHALGHRPGTARHIVFHPVAAHASHAAALTLHQDLLQRYRGCQPPATSPWWIGPCQTLAIEELAFTIQCLWWQPQVPQWVAFRERLPPTPRGLKAGDAVADVLARNILLPLPLLLTGLFVYSCLWP